MSSTTQPEYWLRGPVEGIAAPLQPVAHALLQAREEVTQLMQSFPDALLWERPAALASPAFHLQHLSGVLDRLFTYAKGKALTPDQLQALKAEGQPIQTSVAELVGRFHQQVDAALQQLRNTSAENLAEHRGVGRAQLPSTVLGLLVHAAEHTMRHVGQLLVTTRVLAASQS